LDCFHIELWNFNESSDNKFLGVAYLSAIEAIANPKEKSRKILTILNCGEVQGTVGVELTFMPEEG
jgi:hypothetical protein